MIKKLNRLSKKAVTELVKEMFGQEYFATSYRRGRSGGSCKQIGKRCDELGPGYGDIVGMGSTWTEAICNAMKRVKEDRDRAEYIPESANDPQKGMIG